MSNFILKLTKADICIFLLLACANLLVYLLQSPAVSLDLTLAAKLLLAAVCEELFFRYLLLELATTKLNLAPLKASLLISLAFAALHLVNLFNHASLSYGLVQCCFALGVSLFLCYLYLRLHQLWPCLLLHGLINLTSLLCPSAEPASLTTTSAFLYLLLAVLSFYHSHKQLNGID